MFQKSSNISTKRTVFFMIIAVFFIVLDRFLEALCLKGYFDQSIPIIGEYFSLNYVKNHYIAFSLPFSGPLLSVLIGLIILVLLVYIARLAINTKTNPDMNKSIFPLTILIIGAILNYTDRIKFGFVIDYFYLKHFTIFNLADIMIVSSVIWLIIFSNRKICHQPLKDKVI